MFYDLESPEKLAVEIYPFDGYKKILQCTNLINPDDNSLFLVADYRKLFHIKLNSTTFDRDSMEEVEINKLEGRIEKL
jgi:hypothetical protein